MPGALNTEGLIEVVRNEVGVFDKRRLLDGYATEAMRFAPAPSILVALNSTLDDLCQTGFNKCVFRIPLVAETSEYLFGRQAHDIESQYLEDSVSTRKFPLEKTSASNMDSRWGGGHWRDARGARPVLYYMIGTRGVGFYPVPLLENLVATFIAEAVVAPLVLPTDYPGMILDDEDAPILEDDGIPTTSLPEEHHRSVAIGAAARVSSSFGDKDNTTRLFTEYHLRKEDLRKLVNSRKEVETYQISVRTGRRGSGFARDYYTSRA